MEKILDSSFRVNNICELGKILFSKIDCWFFNLRLCVLCSTNLWTLKILLRNSELGNPPQKSPPTPLCKGGQGGFLGRHRRSDFLVAALPRCDLCGK